MRAIRSVSDMSVSIGICCYRVVGDSLGCDPFLAGGSLTVLESREGLE